MRTIASASPALFCMISLIYPAITRAAQVHGWTTPLPGANIAFAVIAALLILLAFTWFCYSFNRANVRGIHVLFSVFAPTLAAVNGLCFMLSDPSFWPCAYAVAIWFASLFIPVGCNDLRIGMGLRCTMTVLPGICVMLFAFVFVLGSHLF